MTNEDRAGWIGFCVGVLLTLTAVVILLPHPSDAHGVGGRCQTEEYLKVIDRYDVEEGHVHYTCVHPDDYISETIENSYRNSSVSRTVRGSVCEHRRWWYRHHGISILPEACD